MATMSPSTATIMTTKMLDNNNDRMMMGDRKLMNAASPIRGKNQLMVIVGGGETREGGDRGG